MQSTRGRQVAAYVTVKGENKSAPGHGCAFVFIYNTACMGAGEKERDAN
jgi:hypothetical protein